MGWPQRKGITTCPTPWPGAGREPVLIPTLQACSCRQQPAEDLTAASEHRQKDPLLQIPEPPGRPDCHHRPPGQGNGGGPSGGRGRKRLLSGKSAGTGGRSLHPRAAGLSSGCERGQPPGAAPLPASCCPHVPPSLRRNRSPPAPPTASLLLPGRRGTPRGSRPQPNPTKRCRWRLSVSSQETFKDGRAHRV